MVLITEEHYSDFKEESEEILNNIEKELLEIEKNKNFSLFSLKAITQFVNRLTGASLVLELHHISRFCELLEEITIKMVGNKEEVAVEKYNNLGFTTLDSLRESISELKDADYQPVDHQLENDLTQFIEEYGGTRRKLSQREIDTIIKKGKRKPGKV